MQIGVRLMLNCRCGRVQKCMQLFLGRGLVLRLPLSSLICMRCFILWAVSSVPATSESALPEEAQVAAEKHRQTLGFLPSRAAHPRRYFDERLDDNFDAAAFDLIAPNALHKAVDKKHWRNPALRAINATSQIAGQEMLGMARCADHVLIEGRYQPDRSLWRELASLVSVFGQHPALSTVQRNRTCLFAESCDPLAGCDDTASTPPPGQIVVCCRTIC